MLRHLDMCVCLHVPRYFCSGDSFSSLRVQFVGYLSARGFASRKEIKRLHTPAIGTSVFVDSQEKESDIHTAFCD